MPRPEVEQIGGNVRRGEGEDRLDTGDGKKTLAELFDGRSQLLAYNIMFGPSGPSTPSTAIIRAGPRTLNCRPRS